MKKYLKLVLGSIFLSGSLLLGCNSLTDNSAVNVLYPDMKVLRFQLARLGEPTQIPVMIEGIEAHKFQWEVEGNGTLQSIAVVSGNVLSWTPTQAGIYTIRGKGPNGIIVTFQIRAEQDKVIVSPPEIKQGNGDFPSQIIIPNESVSTPVPTTPQPNNLSSSPPTALPSSTPKASPPCPDCPLPPPPPPPPATKVSCEVAGSKATDIQMVSSVETIMGTNVQLQAIVQLADGRVLNSIDNTDKLDALITWSISNTDVATLDSKHKLVPQAPGSAVVRAALQCDGKTQDTTDTLVTVQATNGAISIF